MTDLFRGATAVRAAVVDYLTLMVPNIVDRARTDWGLDEYQLPYPLKYDAYEPYALDQWPLLGVNVTSASRFTRLSVNDDGGLRSMPSYNVRVFTWVRTPMDENEDPLEPEYSESIRLRDDLAACVRAALLTTGNLGQQAIIFDETSLSEEYSEATGTRGDRFVAGVIHSFDIRFDESVPILPLGIANTIDVQAMLIAELEVGS